MTSEQPEPREQPRADASPSGREAPAGGPRLSSVVVFVHDLEESARFYGDLLRMEVTARRSSAVLLSGSGGSQVYLRSIGPKGEHPMGAVGIQYTIWAADGPDDLRRCERFLKDRSAHVATDSGDGYTVVEGRDPNGLTVMVDYPGPDRTSRREIMTRVYAW